MMYITELPEGYVPSETEEYMSPMQLAYFKTKLLDWKHNLQEEFAEVVRLLQEKNWNEPDMNDRASDEADVSLELRTQDRYRKLISKIDDAIARIEVGNYGYCQETNEPIGLKRLEARPIATLSIAAQEKHERFEKSHNEDDY
ncbi:MAG: RNA polymerase-binding protein DksA [Candidatus Midichloria sp.]|nr:MAG: RNA polymerase-binding protein DksA [Candidatus Midichloria sp.]